MFYRYPGRARQNSLTTEVTNFILPCTCIVFGPSLMVSLTTETSCISFAVVCRRALAKLKCHEPRATGAQKSDGKMPPFPADSGLGGENGSYIA